jgi:hypothetical protein
VRRSASERDGDSVVCAVRDATEPVPLQDRGTDAGSGGVYHHCRGGVAAGRGNVLFQEAEGAASVAPPQSRCVPSRRQRHPILRRLRSSR